MGLDRQSTIPYIVDFGIAKQYHNLDTGDHIPFRQTRHLTGTPAFTSINSHLGAELGQWDDLESLAYMLIYFLQGSLPWLSVSPQCMRCHTPNMFGTVNMEHTIDSRLSWSE